MEGLALIWDLISGFCVDVVFWFWLEMWKFILFSDSEGNATMQAVRIVMGLVWTWGHIDVIYFRLICGIERKETIGQAMFHDSRNIAHAMDTIDASRSKVSSPLVSRSSMDKFM